MTRRSGDAGDPRGGLSRREREMMTILYRMGRATAAEVRENLDEPPSYSAVRATLRILVEKGHLRQETGDGQRYLYEPTVPREQARRQAVRGLLETFFGGSVEHAVEALLDVESDDLGPEELDRIQALIDDAKTKERT